MAASEERDSDDEPFVTWPLVGAEIALGALWFFFSALWSLAGAFFGPSNTWNLVAFVLPPVIVAVVIVGQRMNRDRRVLRRTIWTGAIVLTAVWLLAQLVSPNH